jgi:hypothetical protein
MRLRSEEIPHRAALTAPQLVTDEENPTRILLVDPHPPGTWDTWMFPYASLALSAADIRRQCGVAVEFLRLGRGDTVAAVSASLLRLRDLLWRDYQDALSVGYNSLLPDVRDSRRGEPVFRNFSLRFSNTADCYTAYLFDYHRTIFPADRRLSVPHVWVPLEEFAAGQVDSGYRLQDRKVSSTVPEVLNHLSDVLRDNNRDDSR